MRKNVCFWCIFGHWIQICFQNFSTTHTFRSMLKGWNLLCKDTKVCFYCECHEEFKDFYSQEMVSCFAMMFAPLWKCLSMNITKIRCACPLIRQKWAWRWFYSTTVIDSPLFLWLMQPTWRKVMKAWSSFWIRLSMMNLSRNCVCDLKVVALLLTMQLGYTKYCCFLCEWDSQDKKNHYVNKLCPKQTSLMPGEENVLSPPLVFPEKIYLPPLDIKLGLM